MFINTDSSKNIFNIITGLSHNMTINKSLLATNPSEQADRAVQTVLRNEPVSSTSLNLSLRMW